MRYRKEQQFQEMRKKANQEEECSWNNIIVWGICVSVVILVVLYLSFGPNLYHKPPVLIGTETVGAIDEDKRSIPVYEDTLEIDGVGTVYYRYTEPRGRGGHVQPDVLLLHGAKYASQTWKGLGTMQIFSYWGYRTIAIDLPGYKLSKKADPPATSKGRLAFMEAVADALRLSKVVIIAPSMGGEYGLPALLMDNDIDLRGFIAIAPQDTIKYTKGQYQSVDVPVLVMYGERDKTPAKEESIYWMENIPDHTNVMIKRAEHVAFVGNPEDFHKEILRFLSTQCQLGEDTNIDDSDLDSVYDNEDYFGYGWGYGDSDTDSDYYGDSEYENGVDSDYEQYLYNYFNDDSDYNGEYYDDTDLYFDNRFDEGDTEYEEGIVELDTEAEDETSNYRRRNTIRRRRRNRRIRI